MSQELLFHNLSRRWTNMEIEVVIRTEWNCLLLKLES